MGVGTLLSSCHRLVATFKHTANRAKSYAHYHCPSDNPRTLGKEKNPCVLFK